MSTELDGCSDCVIIGDILPYHVGFYTVAGEHIVTDDFISPAAAQDWFVATYPGTQAEMRVWEGWK